MLPQHGIDAEIVGSLGASLHVNAVDERRAITVLSGAGFADEIVGALL